MATAIELARRLVIEREDDLRSARVNKSQLARELQAAYPLVFGTLNAARSAVRSATGANNGVDCAPAIDFRSTIEHGLKAIPTQAKPEEPFVLTGPVTALVIGDLHIPYHNVDAIRAALEYGQDAGTDLVYINGDLVDIYAASRWDKDPRALDLAGECEMVRDFLGTLCSLWPRVIWKHGNHEDRFDRYLRSNAPELIGLPGVSLEEAVLGDTGLPVEVVGARRLARFGKLNVLHGHEFGESIFSPVNPARGVFLRAKCSTLVGHHHQSSDHHENNVNGDAMACWSVGCLCDLQPQYRPFAYTKWNHGFATVTIDADGAFSVRNLRIIDGKCR